MCSRFEPLAEKVTSVFPEMDLDRRELSELTGQLLQFMEDNLGREVSCPVDWIMVGVMTMNGDLLGGANRLSLASDCPFPKLPSVLFRNLSPTGPLFLILTLTLEYKKMKGWERIDFLMSSDKDEVFELFQYLREELSVGFLTPMRYSLDQISVSREVCCPWATLLQPDLFVVFQRKRLLKFPKIYLQPDIDEAEVPDLKLRLSFLPCWESTSSTHACITSAVTDTYSC
eukprot:1184789-Prorocentrum_minimum.AAC.1